MKTLSANTHNSHVFMKSLLITFCLHLYCIALSFNVGFYGGPVISKFYGPDINKYPDQYFRVAGTAKLFGEVVFGSWFSLLGDFGYISKGCNYKLSGDSSGYDSGEWRIRYLQTVVSIKLRTGIRKFHPFILFGPSTTVLLSSDGAKFKANDPKKYDKIDFTDQMAFMDMCFVVGLGCDYQFTLGYLTASVIGQFGRNSALDSWNADELKNLSIIFNLGAAIKIGKRREG